MKELSRCFGAFILLLTATAYFIILFSFIKSEHKYLPVQVDDDMGGRRDWVFKPGCPTWKI